jgi:orotidine-5'-phosphate decarboxylase
MNFYQKLRRIQRKNNSLLCIGLDTDVNKIPRFLLESKDPMYEFNRHIINATKDIVCAYKINLAFYEAQGEHGWYTVHQTLAQIPADVVTIGDGKRGDIGNSSAFYAKLLMEDYEFTASTVSPYMGEDSVAPFLKNRQQGAFVLALTSNPGARDFQYLPVRGRPLYEHVIARARRWNARSNCGLVVGATRSRQLRRVRALVPDMPLLIPGVGAQGGDLRSAVQYGCTADGLMAIINAGRSVIYASQGQDFARVARKAALALRDEINTYRRRYYGG